MLSQVPTIGRVPCERPALAQLGLAPDFLEILSATLNRETRPVLKFLELALLQTRPAQYIMATKAASEALSTAAERVAVSKPPFPVGRKELYLYVPIIEPR